MNSRYLTKIAIVSLLSISIFSPLSAFEIQTHENLNLDTSIARSDLSYSVPGEIVIVPIEFDVNLPQSAKFRGLYYYLVQKLGFSDIPFHYVMSEDGQVFEGNAGGDERKVQVQGIEGTIILVGYLAGSLTDDFDPRSQNSFSELLLDIANRNTISPDKIKISNLKFVRDTENRSVLMQSEAASAEWNASLQKLVAKFSANYAPQPKVYSAQAQIVGIAQEEVDPGSEVTVSIKVKNVGKNGMYGASNSSIALSRQDGSASQFFINNQWLSRSEVGIMVEHQNLLPDQEDIYEFKIKAPIAFGEITELFSLKTVGGTAIQSESMSLTLKMKRGDKRIVQIKNTELGYLKVRSEPSTVGAEIGRVSPGEKFFVVEDAGNGYLKIDLGDGSTGWVAGWFTDTL